MTAVPTADERVGDGLLRTLSRAAADGHCFLPEPRLVVAARSVVDADAVTIRSGLDTLVAAKAVVREDVPGTDPDGRPVTVRAVYLPALHRAEISLANGLLRLLHGAAGSRLAALAGSTDWDRAFSWYAAHGGTVLPPTQRAAVRQAFTSPLTVLSASPGPALPETLDAITSLAAARRSRALLLTPADLAGVLGLRPGTRTAHDRERPVDADLVIVTELSALDLRLVERLVRAVPDGAHLVLAGDPDRRPAPGPGQVLRDLLAAEAVPRTVLDGTPTRRGTGGIAENAYRIRSGEVPRTSGLADFFLFPAEGADRVVELTVEVAARRVPARFDVDPVRDVRVLTAGVDGPAGSVALDAALREVLGPARDGYAVPVDDARGETFPVVVVPVAGLDREGLYTAVSRAGRIVVLVGSRAALAEAVATAGGAERHTMLTYRLGG
jgi:exodeoxyribonuclease V alpha subunit